MTKESHQWYQEVLAAKNGQIERLRAEVEEWKDETNYYQAEARKLRAALEEIAGDPNAFPKPINLQEIARAALANEQELPKPIPRLRPPTAAER